jgi:hypothetical protein
MKVWQTMLTRDYGGVVARRSAAIMAKQIKTEDFSGPRSEVLVTK